jgi:hypothetical protein
MLGNFLQNIALEWQSVAILISLIAAVIHVIFAGAVSRDAGRLSKAGVPIQLVSPVVWAFATLVGGVWVAAIYWVMHHRLLNIKF